MRVLDRGLVRLDPDEHDCGPRFVDLRFALIGGIPELVGLAIHPIPGAERPLSAVQLRRCVAVGGVIPKAVELLAKERALPGLEVDVDELRQLPDLGMRSGGRLSAEHFVRVAMVYAQAVAAKRRDPTRAVAERFGVSRNTAAKWVVRARKLDLLTKTTPGKVSGRMHHGEAAEAD